MGQCAVYVVSYVLSGRGLFVTDGENLTAYIWIAKQYPTEEAAQSGALLLATRYPEWIGELEVREYKREPW